jgi:hypothetical protein
MRVYPIRDSKNELEPSHYYPVCEGPMRKNFPDPSMGDAKTRRGPELHVVQRLQARDESGLEESVQLRAERDSLLWILRIVKREVNWTDDSPTLRMIDAALARS